MDKAHLSKTQVDKLGERLKNNEDIVPDDMRMLDAYRRTFTPAYEGVVQKLVHMGLSPSGRQAKSTTAIVDKLRRESIRLTQIQDIAGCRVIVEGIAAQEKVVELIQFVFDLSEQAIKDRREMPSHGYRAIHVMAHIADKVIEIQVRTIFQDLWAQLSERTADKFDISVKYGKGLPDVIEPLLDMSKKIQAIEKYEQLVDTTLQARKKLLQMQQAYKVESISVLQGIVDVIDAVKPYMLNVQNKNQVRKQAVGEKFKQMFNDLSTDMGEI